MSSFGFGGTNGRCDIWGAARLGPCSCDFWIAQSSDRQVWPKQVRESAGGRSGSDLHFVYDTERQSRKLSSASWSLSLRSKLLAGAEEGHLI